MLPFPKATHRARAHLANSHGSIPLPGSPDNILPVLWIEASRHHLRGQGPRGEPPFSWRCVLYCRLNRGIPPLKLSLGDSEKLTA
jgi:hypothetical protein